MMGVVLADSLLELKYQVIMREKKIEGEFCYLDIVRCLGDTDLVPLLISVTWLSLGDLEKNKIKNISLGAVYVFCLPCIHVR